MTDSLQRLVADKGRLVPLVGAGVSLQATERNPIAGWKGLLEAGIGRCAAMLDTKLPQHWAGTMTSLLTGGDVDSYLTVADDVSRRLLAIGDFAPWIRDTYEGLRPKDDRILKAVCKLNRDLVVTTNYDDLLEQVSRSTGLVWDPQAVTKVDEPSKLVLHLHGMASKPDSVILGTMQYEKMAGREFVEFIPYQLVIKKLVYIGCGDGLRDPNFVPFLRFADALKGSIEKMTQGERSDVRHYLLVPGVELEAARRNWVGTVVEPVAYGRTHADLRSFLESLAAKTPRLDVSQDPRDYTAAPPGVGIGLLERAGPADDAMDRVLEDVTRALRAVSQVERRAQPPTGSAHWDLSDQYTLHRQLAASASEPASRLAAVTARLSEVVAEAEVPAARLVDLDDQSRERLRPLIDKVSDVAERCAHLHRRVAACVEDFEQRATTLGPIEYRVSLARLKDACSDAELTAETLSNLPLLAPRAIA